MEIQPGLTGQLWAVDETNEGTDAENSRTVTINGQEVEIEGNSVEVGGTQITFGTSPDEESTATLLWTDPETHTEFFLSGALSRADMLRMAASVTEKEPEPTESSHHYLLAEGTVYGE